MLGPEWKSPENVGFLVFRVFVFLVVLGNNVVLAKNKKQESNAKKPKNQKTNIFRSFSLLVITKTKRIPL